MLRHGVFYCKQLFGLLLELSEYERRGQGNESGHPSTHGRTQTNRHLKGSRIGFESENAHSSIAERSLPADSLPAVLDLDLPTGLTACAALALVADVEFGCCASGVAGSTDLSANQVPGTLLGESTCSGLFCGHVFFVQRFCCSA